MTERTVRVRIAVAVDETGHWCARGHIFVSDDGARKQALSGVGHAEVCWIEADVPLPSEAVIQGDVSK